MRQQTCKCNHVLGSHRFSGYQRFFRLRKPCDVCGCLNFPPRIARPKKLAAVPEEQETA